LLFFRCPFEQEILAEIREEKQKAAPLAVWAPRTSLPQFWEKFQEDDGEEGRDV